MFKIISKLWSRNKAPQNAIAGPQSAAHVAAEAVLEAYEANLNAELPCTWIAALSRRAQLHYANHPRFRKTTSLAAGVTVMTAPVTPTSAVVKETVGIDLLAEAAKLAAPVKFDGDMLKEAARLREVKSTLLPCEAAVGDKIEERLNELEVLYLDGKYRRLDPVFLRWRNKQTGWPVFAFFAMEHPVCLFRSEREEYQDPRRVWGTSTYELFMRPNMPEFYKDFEDIYTKLISYEGTFKKRTDSNEISAKFNGIIPDGIRTKMRNIVAAGEFERLLIVTEAPVWDIKHTAIPQNLDHLLIGVKLGKIWLLDVFDLRMFFIGLGSSGPIKQE